MAVEYLKHTVHNAISGSIIVIDEMHLNVEIRRYADHIKRQNNFVGYCLAFLTTTLALLTATFTDHWQISADTWQFLFVFADGCLFILACLSGKAYFRNREMTPEELISKIKGKSIVNECSQIKLIPFK